MSLLHMSFAGAVIILAVTVIRAAVMNKLPKTAFLVLWGLALVRLLIPYAVPAAFSVYSLWNRFTAAGEVPGSTFAETTAGNIIAVSPIQDLIPGAAAPAQAVSLSAPKIDPWVLIWIIGMLACGLFFTVSYFRCRREFMKSLPVDNAVSGQWLETHRLNRPIAIRYSDRISAPLTYGVFRPVILMPKATDWNDMDSLQYVLAHEYVHICRFDAVTKLLLTAALCIHWFNPAVWLMYVLANRDIELACDEAVVRQFGERTKAAYAMTLIRMEESRSGLSPLCNSFSKNAIEERIVAIMKLKKPSIAALLTAAAVIAGVTCGFATSAQATSSKTADEKTTDIFPNVAQVTGESTVISYADPRDGKTYYSWDSGITWTPMTDEEFDAVSTPSDIEWWTAEDYAAWLEEEKEALRSIIGEQGWTQSTGWFTWDQQMVDETIAMYEQTLTDIQKGMKISKPMADGDAVMMFGYDENAIEATEADTLASGFSTTADEVVDLSEYAPFGLIEKDGKLIFNGKPVVYFTDRVEFDGMAFIRYNCWSQEKDGAFLHTVRQPTQNPDGSTDPFGKLVEIVEYKDSEIDGIDYLEQGTALQAVTTATGNADNGGTTFADRFAKYKDFGITYVEAKNASGRGNVYLNGQLINRFADVAPDGSAFSFSSADQGGINIQTVYDSEGKLSGIELIKT